MKVIIIPKKFSAGDDLVILRRSDYEVLKLRTVIIRSRKNRAK